jgi:malonyl CoA-acyl carrier protein transacylase
MDRDLSDHGQSAARSTRWNKGPALMAGHSLLVYCKAAERAASFFAALLHLVNLSS